MQQTEPPVLRTLAHLLGTAIINHRLDIPEKYGSGFCAGYVFNEHIRLFILHYQLNQELELPNTEKNTSQRTILFKFKHVIPPDHITPADASLKAIPSVLITTSSLHADDVIPIHTHTGTINIEVDADYLNGLFETPVQSPVLQSLLQNTQPLLFEQAIHPLLQQMIEEILAGPANANFALFFRRVKAEELICRLLMELEKREDSHLYALNNQDIQTLYQIKDQLLSQLDTPPVIDELAESAHMSATKLKRLFKQIFGDSIFRYYQTFRMKEAARLLKEEKRSVSEVGYQLGFSNLSHFTRVFKAHTGMNPKQYSLS